MKTPTFGDKKMEDDVVKFAGSEDRGKQSWRRFIFGLVAGIIIAAVVGGLVITAMYIGLNFNSKTQYKEYTADVGKNRKEYIYVTENIEEYNVDGTRVIYDFERGLVTMVFPGDNELPSGCFVSSFDTSEMIDPKEILDTMPDSEITLEEKESKEANFEITDILLNEKALSLRTRSACQGKTIRMLRTAASDVPEHRQTRAVTQCYEWTVIKRDGTITTYRVCITYGWGFGQAEISQDD